MAMAATFAGMGFGNAGVHIPHANGYPIAGRVKDFHAKDYPQKEPMVPSGLSVAITASEAFRFTFDSSPERHLHRSPAGTRRRRAERPRRTLAGRPHSADARHRDSFWHCGGRL